MTERKSFFTSETDQKELESLAVDGNATNRWLAAIKLSEIKELWSAKVLWRLKVDEDTNARSAAINALKSFPPNLLSQLSSDVSETSHPSDDFSQFESWKSWILSPFSAETREEYVAAIMSIIAHEGPTTGGRIQRLLQLAAQPGGGGRISQGKLRPLLQSLLGDNSLTRADEFFDSDNTDLWILHLPGRPSTTVRPRNERFLTEIPVNEARQVLLNDQRFKRRPDNRDVAFAVLQRHYEIQSNELHLVGEALEGQWRNLFRNSTSA